MLLIGAWACICCCVVHHTLVGYCTHLTHMMYTSCGSLNTLPRTCTLARQGSEEREETRRMSDDVPVKVC